MITSRRWLRDLAASARLLGLMVVLLCGLYPAVLWAVGQVFFPAQADGSLLAGPDGRPVGSRLIAQPFTRDEYFQPRPSAAAYDASASASSTLAPSNYLLRDRVARMLGPMATYRSGPDRGQRVGPGVERWFQADRYRGAPHLVAQWAEAHPGLARAWIGAEPVRERFVIEWARHHPDMPTPASEPRPAEALGAQDVAVEFFASFSRAHPGCFLAAVTRATPGGRITTLEPVREGPDVQSIFFDMWRDEHPDVDLADIPGDLVTTSGSGLDPHITLPAAEYQLDRVAAAWARTTKRDRAPVLAEVGELLRSRARAPLGGLVGEPLVNVLEVNLALRARYGPPAD